MDESVQFGNKKLLLVLAVSECRCSQDKPLSFKDITPLILKVSESWKSDHIAPEIEKQIDLKQVSYCISDTGNNLTRAINLLNCKHIPDVNHKFSLIVQSVFEKNPLFDQYTKTLAALRTKKSMSRISRIVPPNQRIMCRFMNLMPLFKWGMEKINLLDNKKLTKEEEITLSFLQSMREFIFDTYQVLIRLNKMQKMLKSKGFNDESKNKVISLFSDMNSDNSLKIKEKINEYFADLTSKSEGKTICCSSDIIESFLSKYKEIVRGNKSFGIPRTSYTVQVSDLCLCIAAMAGKNNAEKTNEAMEKVRIKQLEEWKTNNVSKTLFAEKIELNKKIDRSYFAKK